MSQKITVTALIECNIEKTWLYYTAPEHITQWNFADDSWHCPSASNDLTVGGQYSARMETKDGSFGFDFTAVYTAVDMGNSFSFALLDNRQVDVSFADQGNHTRVTVLFDAEGQDAIELQQEGWQAILNHFKAYAQSH